MLGRVYVNVYSPVAKDFCEIDPNRYCSSQSALMELELRNSSSSTSNTPFKGNALIYVVNCTILSNVIHRVSVLC